MRRVAMALAASVLTAVYWWAAFLVVYAGPLFAGDRDPASSPAPDREIVVRNGMVIVAAVLIYAMLILLWRRLTTRSKR